MAAPHATALGKNFYARTMRVAASAPHATARGIKSFLVLFFKKELLAFLKNPLPS
jgi:hypothetical protein